MSATTIPDPGDPNDVEALFAAWAVRAEGGELVPFEELLATHPGHAEALAALHADWQLFAPLLGRAVPGRIHDSAGIVLAPLSGAEEPDAAAPSPELLARLGFQMPEAGRYRFRAVIGRGGGGVVLKVWDAKLNRPLAMKVVLGRGEERPDGSTPRVDGRTLSRFVDEARIASQLNHPGIVPVHELGADEAGRAYFTMKLVKGEDLARVFEHVKTGHDGWNPTRALNAILRVCESVAFAHEKGVIHRDLKPANVMVGRHGEVYVMDWGLARVLGEEDRRDVRVRPPPATSALLTVRSGPPDRGADSPLYTMDGDVVGTPAYMAPEQAAGRLDQMGPHSDVYAVGAMIYQLLAGHMPYVPEGARLNNYAVWQRVQEGPPTPIENLTPKAPLELVAICEKAMAREIPNRYPDVRALATDLRAYIEGRVVSAYEAGAWAETRKWVKRHRALAAAIALAIASTLLGSIAFKLKADEARKHANESTWNAYVAAISIASGARAIGEPGTVRRMLDAAPLKHRGWEWGYLNAVSDTSLLTLKGGPGYLSPDGLLVATLCADGSIRLSSAKSGQKVRDLDGQVAGPSAWSFSEDGGQFWAAYSKSVILWETATGRTVLRLQDEHCDSLGAADVSDDGRRILTTPDTDEHVHLWDGTSGKLLSVLERDPSYELGVYKECRASFSPDGGRVLARWGSGPPYVYDAETGHAIACLNGHTDEVNAAQFSPDGRMIATASDDGFAIIWDAASGARLHTMGPHEGSVEIVQFGKNGTLLATAGFEERENPVDSSLLLWSVISGELIHSLRWGRGSTVSSSDGIAFSPDDDSVLAWRYFGGGQPQVWSTTTGECIATLSGWSGEIHDGGYSPNGNAIALACSDARIRVWAANASGKDIEPVEQFEGHQATRITSLEFAPDDQWMLSSNEKESRIWGPWPGKMIQYEDYPDGGLGAPSRAEDGAAYVRRYETNHSYSLFQICEIEKREPAHFEGADGFVNTIRVTDSRLAGFDQANWLRVWDRRTGVLLGSFETQADLNSSSGFLSIDGRKLVLRSPTVGVAVHDVETGRLLAVLEDALRNEGGFHFDPSGSLVAPGVRVVVARFEELRGPWPAVRPVGAQLDFLPVFLPVGQDAPHGGRAISGFLQRHRGRRRHLSCLTPRSSSCA